MNPYQPYSLPPEQDALRTRARRLAWFSIWLLGSSAVALALALGRSQSMRTAWVSELLSIVPAVAYLVALRFELRPPTERFPYGYTRAISVSFLVTAASLSIFGLTLFGDAVMKLVRGERPPIGSVVLFGHQIWAGWTMIAAVGYSLACGMICGRLKLPVGRALQDRALVAEAQMNRDGWTSDGAAIVGLLLVGFGFWWGDSAAAALISVNIIRDAWATIQNVIADLMDESPNVLGERRLEDLPDRVRAAAEGYDWVERAAVRLREHGRLVTGDVFLVVRDGDGLPARIERASRELATLDWRLHGLTVMPVPALAPAPAARSG